MLDSLMSAKAYPDMDLLRFTTAGSVDDGKSTLIGRLLHDTKSIFEDQMEQVLSASRKLGDEGLNLALLTDGLRAEREQKITIDVAYRYFATPKRKFIIADTPGHIQYTRNMVTGASTADLAIILVDAEKGVSTQSRRHAFITSLLGIPHVIVAVNKMDLVGFSEEVYDAIRADFAEFATKLTVKDISYVPISALHGDNVVSRSTRTPWYEGGALLHKLEDATVGARQNHIDFRFPVQYVIRPNQRFRGFAGTVASGTVRPGEEITVLPSRQQTRVKSIESFDGPRDGAAAGDAVVLTTEDEVDISRGDMLVRRKNIPSVDDRFAAFVCWMSETPMVPGRSYRLLHTTREVHAAIEAIDYRVDVDTLHREKAPELGLNEIGRVEVSTSRPLFFDSYLVNGQTGSFVLVDPHTHGTVAAGMIRGPATRIEPAQRGGAPGGARPISPDVVWESWNIDRATREARSGHRAVAVWFTGMSGAGKSSIARALERALFDRGRRTMLLDGDQVRHGLCGDLGFSAADRRENIRRVGEVAKLFFEQGSVVLCSFVSPFRADREGTRQLFPDGRFVEVYVHAPLEVLRERDPKGLYAREARREVSLSGSEAPYEPPLRPEIDIDTSIMGVEEAVELILDELGPRLALERD
jgi:bifunctional enzyme CysN/CysC